MLTERDYDLIIKLDKETSLSSFSKDELDLVKAILMIDQKDEIQDIETLRKAVKIQNRIMTEFASTYMKTPDREERFRSAVTFAKSINSMYLLDNFFRIVSTS